MAEVEVKDSSAKGGKVRSKKQSTKVDMTPMVDLGFLLITFFMFTTTFSKPNTMDLGLPAKPDPNAPKPPPTEIKLANSITLILGKDNRVFWHQQDRTGLSVTTLNETSFNKSAVSEVVEKAKKGAVDQDKFTVIIKPSDDAVYKNFVDMLDEMAITKTDKYGITDIKDWEKAIYDQKVGNTPTAEPTNP